MPPDHQQGAKRVLVVDDEHVIADTLALIFKQQGYETATAYGGRQAIQVAGDFLPHVLISDILMPDVDGIDAAVQILLRVPDCRVVLISGQADSWRAGERVRRHGREFPVLAKPIHPKELLDRIGELVRPSTSPARVLNVDDNDIQRYAVSRMLRAAGFEVWEAATGEEALRSAKRHPDIIVLDLNLPDVNGFEVCRRLKNAAETARIPIIHLTNTFRDEASAQKSRESGADVYLTHPIQAPDLLERLQKLIVGTIENRS